MPEKPSQGNEWTEHDSQVFLEVAELVVPSRQEQQRILCDLIPADAEEEFAVAELGAGDGRLALGVLKRFPRCRYWACERSTLLRTEIAKVLDRFRDRVEIHDFELADQTWRRRLPSNLRCVLVSLAVHHLPAAQKRTLFKDIAARLVPRGALLLADLVEPSSAQARALFARQWDDAVRSQSLATAGNLRAFEQFRDHRWNYYADPAPDPYDQPSPLLDQLRWLQEVAFERVECFWMYAGHAIFGGYMRE